jgi:O-antigen/teichoic acid export membrane protein
LVFIGLSVPTSQILTSASRMWFGFSCLVGYAIIYGALGLALVPRYGAEGLAAASPLAHLIAAVLSIWFIYARSPELLNGIPLATLWFGACAFGGLVGLASLWLPPYGQIGVVLIMIPFCVLGLKKLNTFFAH